MHIFVSFIVSSILILNILLENKVTAKYLEGELKTSEDWTFVARFCFLSEEGEFEYRIEFNEEYGYPNLLLYYDTEEQWPAVYKTGKTCHSKESVLKAEQNQIVNLTIKTQFHREFSGCMAIENNPFLPQTDPTTQRPKTTTIRYTEPIITKKRRTKIQPTTPTTTHKTSTITSTDSVDIKKETTGYVTDFQNITTDTPEMFEETQSLFYQGIQEDVENIYENTDTNQTELMEDYRTTANVPIRKRSLLSIPLPTQPQKNRQIICHNSRRFRSSRERWWFVAVSNCNGHKGIHIKYKFLMTNGPPGDYWHQHFSADEFYVLPVLMTFSLAYSFLLLGVIVCTIELKTRQLLHSTYKLFVFSVIAQFLGILFKNMAYLKYAFNGVGAPKVKMFGEIFMGCSEICFLLLLILLAKGYTITRGRLSINSSIKLTIFMCIYSITYICLFIYQEKVFDPGEVLYLYESPAGYGLIFLKILAWIMFIYSTIITLKHYPEKSNFYYPFNIFGTFWFVAGPAFILSANTYIDKWVRESVVNAVLLLIAFGGHLMFLVLTMPSRANKNFPYHVRTTQIGVMEATGASTLEHFNHHPYEPTTDLCEQTIIIPLTKRTEELFNGVYAQKLNSSMRSTNRQNNNENTGERIIDTIPEVCMQNVLNWAIARDYSNLAVPTFERVHQGNSFRSVRSGERDAENDYSSLTLKNQNQSPVMNDLSDYIRDVPVELFTVSKMVVTANYPNNENDQNH